MTKVLSRVALVENLLKPVNSPFELGIGYDCLTEEGPLGDVVNGIPGRIVLDILFLLRIRIC